MIVLHYFAYFLAAGIAVNGLFHFSAGMLGRKFISKPRFLSEKRYEKMLSRKGGFNSAVYNVIYGTINFAIAFLLVLPAGLKFGMTWETGIFVLNFILSSILVAWNFEGTLS